MLISLDHDGRRRENARREDLLEAGVPVVAIDAAELAATKAAAELAIDAAAEAARGRRLTLSPGMVMTYAAKETQAIGYEAATAAAKADPARWTMLAPEAKALGVPLEQHAAVVRAKAAGFHALGGRIEAARAGGKKDVESRRTPHTVAEALKAAVDALTAI